jgi:hypothetical protein
MNTNLIIALIAVESGGNDLAVGDHGRAVGALQIHAEVVQDVNKIAGTHYTHSGMTNRADAVKVCTIYIGHWATAARLGRPVTDEDRARIWNGGPNGHKKTSTKQYAEKVRSKWKK